MSKEGGINIEPRLKELVQRSSNESEYCVVNPMIGQLKPVDIFRMNDEEIFEEISFRHNIPKNEVFAKEEKTAWKFGKRFLPAILMALEGYTPKENVSALYDYYVDSEMLESDEDIDTNDLKVHLSLYLSPKVKERIKIVRDLRKLSSMVNPEDNITARRLKQIEDELNMTRWQIFRKLPTVFNLGIRNASNIDTIVQILYLRVIKKMTYEEIAENVMIQYQKEFKGRKFGEEMSFEEKKLYIRTLTSAFLSSPTLRATSRYKKLHSSEEYYYKLLLF